MSEQQRGYQQDWSKCVWVDRSRLFTKEEAEEKRNAVEATCWFCPIKNGDCNHDCYCYIPSAISPEKDQADRFWISKPRCTMLDVIRTLGDTVNDIHLHTIEADLIELCEDNDVMVGVIKDYFKEK